MLPPFDYQAVVGQRHSYSPLAEPGLRTELVEAGAIGSERNPFGSFGEGTCAIERDPASNGSHCNCFGGNPHPLAGPPAYAHPATRGPSVSPLPLQRARAVEAPSLRAQLLRPPASCAARTRDSSPQRPDVRGEGGHTRVLRETTLEPRGHDADDLERFLAALVSLC